MMISFWTQTGPASGLVLTAWLILYLGRSLFHKTLRAGTRLVRQPLHLGAQFLRSTAGDMQRRNRALLEAQARADAGLRVEREWARLDEIVRRDVQGFPELQKVLIGQIEQWDQDFKRSAEVPQLSPEWTKAVAAVMRLKAVEDPMMERMQMGFKGAVEKAQSETLRYYQKMASERHRVLARSQQMWGVVGTALEQLDHRLARVAESAFTVHGAVQRYEALCREGAHLDRRLVSSALVRLLVAGFVLFAIAGGVLLDVHLMAGPLTVLGWGTPGLGAGHFGPHTAALALIGVEVVAGLVLFDALNVTHLFGLVVTLARPTRQWLVGGAVGVLLALAGLEAMLAFVRSGALSGLSSGHGAAAPELIAWQAAAKVLLALILPCVMAFVAIPLEAFIYALRATSGLALETAVRVLAFTLRMVARLVGITFDALSATYDLLILPPLLLERAFQHGLSLAVFKRRGASGNP